MGPRAEIRWVHELNGVHLRTLLELSRCVSFSERAHMVLYIFGSTIMLWSKVLSGQSTQLMLNKTIIENFSSYIEQLKSDTCDEPSKLSTVIKAKGHLFHYHDSFLNYEYSKDCDHVFICVEPG